MLIITPEIKYYLSKIVSIHAAGKTAHFIERICSDEVDARDHAYLAA